jgi:hypothetical protein
MVLTHLEIQRVQPDEGVLALQRAVPERLHHLVQLLADAGNPALPGTARHIVPMSFGRAGVSIPVSPNASRKDIGTMCSRSSTRRVLTPSTYACCTTAKSAFSDRRRGSSRLGK